MPNPNLATMTKGSLTTVSVSISYILMGIVVQRFLPTVAKSQLVFYQSVIGLILISFVICVRRYTLQSIITHCTIWQVLRNLSSLLAVLFLFLSLNDISLFLAYLIINFAPFILLLMRTLFFQKTVNTRSFLLLLVAFSGLFVTLLPNIETVHLRGFLFACLSCFCMVFSMLLLEKERKSDRWLSVFYYFVTATIACGIAFMLLPKNITYQNISVEVPILIIGLLFFWIQAGVIIAVRYINAYLISIIYYSEVIMALFYTMMIQTHQLRWSFIIGALIVVASGVGLLVNEHRSMQRAAEYY